jgi:hypothetical protein
MLKSWTENIFKMLKFPTFLKFDFHEISNVIKAHKIQK